mgnify:CR=1 FL=1
MTLTDADILIIAGSAEARLLAAALPGRACALLPETERRMPPWPVPVAGRVEGACLVVPPQVRLVVDASHPNDWQASEWAARGAAAAGVPILRLERAPWRPSRRDRWVRLRDERAARFHVVPGERVFLATGRETLMRFACLNGVYVYARQRSEHHDPFPLQRGRFLRGAAPFSAAGEAALLRRLGIDWLILRNAGGPGGWPKLEAARRLGLRVGMIDRPILPSVPVVRDVAGALDRIATWLA